MPALTRGKQILELLIEHGPLSARTLRQILKPAIHPRRLREVLKRLEDSHLITKRHDRIFRGAGVYYQISQDPSSLPAISIHLDRYIGSLAQPQFRHAELIHSERCALWAERLKTLFPTAKVLRDYELHAYPSAHTILLMTKMEFELKPDLLLIAPALTPEKNDVAVAVEIERHAKSKERWQRKLRRYADATLLDGLIYICDTALLAVKIRSIYQSEITLHSLRTNHYGKNFFIFSDGSIDTTTQEPKMFNSALEPVRLTHWMHYLQNTFLRKRRDFEFNPPAS